MTEILHCIREGCNEVVKEVPSKSDDITTTWWCETHGYFSFTLCENDD